MAKLIIGRNPIIEALKSGRGIDKIMIGKDGEGSIKKIVAMAKDRDIPIQYCEKVVLDRMATGQAHQGVVAQVSDYFYCQVEDILERAAARGEEPFLLILDGLSDPHNLGAIMRSAEVCGAHGVIIPKRRSVGMTETVVKASAGAVEYLPCARVVNLARTANQLKKMGIWIGACDMEGPAYYDQNLTGGLALVIGSEGSGISRLHRETYDCVVSIPTHGNIDSLNASNAATVLLCEVARQRYEADKTKGISGNKG
jgi:23S rRNA (guanosine2251-2'-O)-methyltransferase